MRHQFNNSDLQSTCLHQQHQLEVEVKDLTIQNETIDEEYKRIGMENNLRFNKIYEIPVKEDDDSIDAENKSNGVEIQLRNQLVRFIYFFALS